MVRKQCTSPKLAIVKQTDSYLLSPVILLPHKPHILCSPPGREQVPQGSLAAGSAPGSATGSHGAPRSSPCCPAPLRGHRGRGAASCFCPQCCPGSLHYQSALSQVIPSFLHPWGHIHDPGEQTCLSKGKGHMEGVQKGQVSHRCQGSSSQASHCTQLGQPGRDSPGSLLHLFCKS